MIRFVIYLKIMSQIFVYSGPLHSGKTTRLEQWIKKTPAVDGILTPVIKDKRHIKFIKTGEMYQLETDSQDAAFFQQIGKYKFRTDVFQKARKFLINLIDNTPAWIVIDEIGFLELDGHGFEPVVSELIHKLDSAKDVHILIVVRDYLKEKVMDYYKLDANKVIDFILE